MGKIILLVSAAGGQGKSTIAVGLAKKLSESTKGSVALLDGCTDGRATDMLDESPTVSYDIGDVMSRQCDTPDAAYWSDGGFLIMANPNDDASFSVGAVRSLFDDARELFDYSVFDCPTGSFARMGAIASCADVTLICTQADPFHLSAASRLRRLLPEQDEQCRLVVTGFSRNDFKRGYIENIDECIDTVKARLIGIVPEDAKLMHIGSGQKFPLSSPGVTAIGNIAHRLMGHNVPLMDI